MIDLGFYSVIGLVIVLAVIVLLLVRLFFRLIGHSDLLAEGVVVKEDGIEYLGLGKVKTILYTNIENIRLISLGERLTAYATWRFGTSIESVRGRIGGDSVLITLRCPQPCKYVMFTPKHPAEFIDKVTARLKGPA